MSPVLKPRTLGVEEERRTAFPVDPRKALRCLAGDDPAVCDMTGCEGSDDGIAEL